MEGLFLSSFWCCSNVDAYKTGCLISYIWLVKMMMVLIIIRQMQWTKQTNEKQNEHCNMKEVIPPYPCTYLGVAIKNISPFFVYVCLFNSTSFASLVNTPYMTINICFNVHLFLPSPLRRPSLSPLFLPFPSLRTLIGI